MQIADHGYLVVRQLEQDLSHEGQFEDKAYKYLFLLRRQESAINSAIVAHIAANKLVTLADLEAAILSLRDFSEAPNSCQTFADIGFGPLWRNPEVKKYFPSSVSCTGMTSDRVRFSQCVCSPFFVQDQLQEMSRITAVDVLRFIVEQVADDPYIEDEEERRKNRDSRLKEVSLKELASCRLTALCGLSTAPSFLSTSRCLICLPPKSIFQDGRPQSTCRPRPFLTFCCASPCQFSPLADEHLALKIEI